MKSSSVVTLSCRTGLINSESKTQKMKVDYNKDTQSIHFQDDGVSGEKNGIVSSQNEEKNTINGSASSHKCDQSGVKKSEKILNKDVDELGDEITEINSSRKCSLDSGVFSRSNSNSYHGTGDVNGGKFTRCNKIDASRNKFGDKKAFSADDSAVISQAMGSKASGAVDEAGPCQNGESLKEKAETGPRKFLSLKIFTNESSSENHDNKIDNKGAETDVKQSEQEPKPSPDSRDSICSADWDTLSQDDTHDEEKPIEKGFLQRLFSTTSSSSSTRSRKNSLTSLASFTCVNNNNNSLMYVSGVRYNPECMEMCKTERFVVRDSLHLGFDALSPHTVLDTLTGHLVLEYMEAHVSNPSRLDEEWEQLCEYSPEGLGYVTDIASDACNVRKNRSNLALPYDNNRVVLNKDSNVTNSDYINASYIKDNDPRCSCYIVTQGPLPHTVADFWQMIWEQDCNTIINLTSLVEDDVTKCFQYWPYEGCDLYHVYEVHLVSEHVHRYGYIDTDDENENVSENENENEDNDNDNASVIIEDEDIECVIRSFFVRNIRTGSTRTVTQFHYMGWLDHQSPCSTTSLLHFRRKIKKSLAGTNSPIVVHCSDGVGRTGTYCLLDMVLSRLSKGVRQIDISATLEHLRDQHANMVETKEQFEFVLHAMAEDVENSLNVTRF